MTKEQTLQDLFVDSVKDIYFAEKKILTALPKMEKAAQSDELKAAFAKHLKETEGQIQRLEEVFAEIGEKPHSKTCDAIMGILEEGKKVMEKFKRSEALDAALISSAQAVEHYEMARYGSLVTWADELGHEKSHELLQATLDEEVATDEALEELATDTVNELEHV